jgi:cobalamin-dependent methionine synthase I
MNLYFWSIEEARLAALKPIEVIEINLMTNEILLGFIWKRKKCFCLK